MIRLLPAVIALASGMVLQGCIARTVLDVATAPVRAGSKAVDLATTSQAEADEKRGRDMRRRETRLGELEREFATLEDDCARGQVEACARRRAIAAEIEQLLPGLPARYDD